MEFPKVGQIIEHDLLPEMGRTRVERLSTRDVDLRTARLHGWALRTFQLPNESLRLSADQSNEGFDAAPRPTRTGGSKPRATAPPVILSFDDGVARFLGRYPGGFEDPGYIKDERAYKGRCLETWQANFGPDAFPAISADPARITQAFAAIFKIIPLASIPGEWLPFQQAAKASPVTVELAKL